MKIVLCFVLIAMKKMQTLDMQCIVQCAMSSVWLTFDDFFGRKQISVYAA